MNPLLIYTPRWKTVLLLLGSLAFTLACAVMMLTDDNLSVKAWIFLPIGILFFGAAAVLQIVALVRREPVLELDAQGITQRGGMSAFGRLAWPEIGAVQIYEMRRQRMLAIHLVNPQAVLARIPKGSQFMVNANSAVGGAKLNIAQTTLPFKLETLIEEMRKRNPALVVLA